MHYKGLTFNAALLFFFYEQKEQKKTGENKMNFNQVYFEEGYYFFDDMTKRHCDMSIESLQETFSEAMWHSPVEEDYDCYDEFKTNWISYRAGARKAFDEAEARLDEVCF